MQPQSSYVFKRKDERLVEGDSHRHIRRPTRSDQSQERDVRFRTLGDASPDSMDPDASPAALERLYGAAERERKCLWQSEA
jgi:hypothetical protein